MIGWYKKKCLKSGYIRFLGFLIILFAGSNVQAQTWVGGVDSLWTTAGNWDNNAVPGFNDNVVIDADDKVVIESASGLARTVTIGTNDTLVIKSGDHLAVDRDVVISGVLTLEGTATLNYGLDWFRDGIFNCNQSTVTHTSNRAQNIVYSETFYNLAFNKTNQVVTNSSDITVLNDLTITAGTFDLIDHNGIDLTVNGDIIIGIDNTDALDLTDTSADGLTLLIGGDFILNNTNANSFQAGTASNIIFNGSGAQRLTPATSGDGETFVNLFIRKNNADRLDIDNPIQIEGDLKIDSGLVKLNGNQIILGTDSADSLIIGGTLEIDGGARLKMENGTNLITNSGGTFSVVGSPSNSAIVTQNSGNYNIEINSGGTIKAQYYTFEYMNASGLQINDGAVVDATHNFSDGTIDNIAASGTGLNVGDISGTQQRLVIDNVVFPTNAGVGASNVTKSNSTDTLEFTNSTGNFTGEFFDNDPNNLVIWTNAVLTRQWVGNISSDWGTAGNWSPAGVPSSGDNVEIPTGSFSPFITSSASCKDLLIHQNGFLVVGSEALSVNLDINGNFTIGDSSGASNGSLTIGGTSTVNIGGNYYKTDVSTVNENNSTIIFDGDSNQKITSGGVTASDDFYNITINNSGGTVGLLEDILILGNFTISSGTFDVGSSDMTIYQNWSNSGTFTPGTGTVTFDTPSTGPFDINSGGSSFNNLAINSANENNVLRLISALDINGNLDLTQGTLDANGNDIAVAGNINIDGNFIARSGTLTIDGISDQIVYFGSVILDNFLVNKTSGTAILNGLVTPEDALTTTGYFAIVSGNFNSGALNMQIGGNWSNSGVWTQSGGTVTFAATDVGPYTIGNNGSGSFNNLTIDGTTTTYQLSGGMDIDGDLTINTGNTLSAGVNTINSSGDWTNNGTFQGGSGTVILDGGLIQRVNIGGSSFNELTVNKSANRAELDAATTVISDLNVQSGELRTDVSLDVNGSIIISSGATYNMNGNTATVFGGLENNGTLSTPAGLTFDGSTGGPYNINSGSSSLADVTFNAAGLAYQLSGHTDIKGNLTITAGKLDLNGNTLIFGDSTVDAITVDDTLEIDAGSELSLFNGTSLDVSSGGVIQIVGISSSSARLTEQSKSGSYTFTVNTGATIHAQYALFEYFDVNGINIADGASIDITENFSDVSFNNGQAGGTMLNVGDITGSLTKLDITNAGFLLNPGSGATNVTHTTGSDTLHFISAFGPFAGENYDSDSGGDNLILWSSSAITRVWDGSNSTDWNDSQNWAGGIVPADTEDVDIPASGVTNEPLVSGTIVCRNVTIASGRTLTIQSGDTLDSGGSVLNNGIIVLNTTSYIMVEGDFDNTNGSITESTSTLVLDGTSTQFLTSGGITASDEFYNITINKSGGTTILTEDIIILGDFVISNGIFDSGNNSMTVNRNWNNSGTFIAGSGTVTFDAPSAGSFDINSGGSPFNHVTINSPNENNVQRLISALDIDGNLSLTQGTINSNTYDISVAGNLVIDIDFGNFTASTGTVTFDGSIDQSIDPGNVFFNNFTINKSGGTATLSNVLTATGNLTITSGTLNTAARNVNVGGNWDNNGTWIQSGGTVTLNAIDVGPYTIGNNGSGSFNNLTIDGTTTTYQLSGGMDIDGDLTINTGNTLSAGVNTINSSGDWTNNGTFQGGSGTVILDGDLIQRVNIGGSSFNELTVNKSANRAELDAATTIGSDLNVLSGELRTDAALDVNGNVSVSFGGIYNMNTAVTTIAGGLSNGGTISNPGALTFDGSTGGPYAINSGISSLADVTINATDLVYQLSGTTDINGNLTITNGKLDLNGQTLTFGDNAADAITVDDTLEIDAGAELSLFSGTSVDIDGVAYIVGESANDAIITEQSKSGSYSFSVNSGGVLHARYVLFEYMDATGIQVLTGAILDPVNNFSNCTFDNGTSGGTLLYVENLWGVNQLFSITSASFPSDPGGGAANVTKSVSNDTLEFLTSTGSFAGEEFEDDPGNLVRWGSVSGLLTWTGNASTNWHTASNWSPIGVPDATKAVIINNQTNDPVIGNDNAAVLNVTLGSGATLTIQDGFDLDINGDITNSFATFVVGNTTSTINIAGDWANNGTFTNGNSTITFDGTQKQTVNPGGTGTGKSFNNFYCTNPDTIELLGTLDIDGDLFVSDGYLNLNGNQLIFGDTSADSVSISGEVIINDDAILQMASGARIVVESGGNLQIQGTSEATRPQVTNQGSGNYSIEVLSGGTIEPEMATIENTGGNGIEINNGAIINTAAKFDNVIFQNGAGSAYMTIENAQSLNILDIQFVSSGPTYNVSYGGTGQIQFSDYSGAMSGAMFESDNGSAPHGNIRWDFVQTEVVNDNSQTFGNDAVISSTGNLGTVIVELVDQTLGIAPASVARYFTIDPQNSTDATVRLYYSDDELGGELEADLQMWRRRNDLWEQLGGSLNTSQNYVEVSSSVYTFSAGVIDTLILSDAENDASLPVELLSFDAVVMKDSVVLKWMTATELENAFWIIEKKNLSLSEYKMIQDGEITMDESTNKFSQLTQVQGMGSKPTSTSYTYADHEVAFGKIYAYRLSSVSLGGEIESFMPVIASYADGRIPVVFTLEQNYPNPFNPVTTIGYQLPSESKVTIEVYNILGQNVIQLVNDKKEAGFYDVQWDGRNKNGVQLATGVYIYRMTAETIDSRERFLMNKRMILVK